ncbi:MAG: hypothetical protein ACREJ3_02965, partial [Polyangiaceae bacterium]
MKDQPPTRVALPARVTVATLREVQAVLGACEELERGSDGAILDSTVTTMFGPMGICLLAASTAERRAAARSTRLVAPAEDEAARFLREIQFDRFVEG